MSGLLLTILIVVDTIMGIKILSSMVRAKFVKADYATESYYARLGFLGVFHVCLAIMACFGYYIHLIVKATL